MKLQRYFVALALALTLGACENVADVTAPQLQPGSESLAKGVNGYGKGGKKAKQEYVYVTMADFEANPVSVELNNRGGVLNLADRVILEVPKNAVSGKVVFTMEKVPGDELIVKLSATSSKKGATYNDVGSAGFNIPLKLTFRVPTDVALPDDPSALKVLYVGGATPESQPTVVTATGATIDVTGDVTHFSPYAVGWPE